MGYRKEVISESLDKERFDEIHAMYLLMGEKKPEVRFYLQLGSGVF